MALDAADWSVAINGDIRWTGGGTQTNVTTIELHRFLQQLADDEAATGDDILDVTDRNPSERSTDNIITLLDYSGTGGPTYNIDDTAATHIFDGSIIQNGGAEIYDGILIIGNCTFVSVLQNGSLISTANDFWNDNTPSGYNPDAAQGISHRFMLKVRTGGADTDGRRLTFLTREWGKTYGEFSVNGTARGNNVVALSDADDLNNATAVGTVGAYDQFSNTEGYQLLDVEGDAVADEPYYSQWINDAGATPASPTINDLYEWTKYVSRRGSTSTLYGLVQTSTPFRGVTHEIDLTNGTASTFVEPEQVSWTGGTGQLLAIDDTAAASATKMWIQLLTGTAPSNTDTITGAGGGTADCSGTPTARTPVPQPFLGQSTGGAIIGGYGAGIRAADLTFPDKLTDLGNTLREAPNNVTFTVEGLEVGDRVLVTQYDAVATDIDKDQYALSGPVNGAAVGTITVQTAIQSDTPQSGIALRVVNDEGYDVYLPVASWTGSTFTLSSTYDFSGTGENDSAANGNNVYVGYIDKDATATSESFTVVYTADRSLFVRVRDGAEPIRTFETTASLTSTGGSATAIRTADA